MGLSQRASPRIVMRIVLESFFMAGGGEGGSLRVESVRVVFKAVVADGVGRTDVRQVAAVVA